MAFSKRVSISAALVAVLLAGIITVVYSRRSQEVACLSLSDGTHAYFQRDTQVISGPNFSASRVLRVDGKLLLMTAPGPALTVQSRLLRVTVAGGSTIRVIAYSSQPGEEVDVLRGSATATKAYRSSHYESDPLSAGEMLMVNQEIDLIETEKGKAAELRDWAEDANRAARARCSEASAARAPR